MKKFLDDWGFMFFLITAFISCCAVVYWAVHPATALQPPPKTPAIIIKMDYETVKRIDARLDAIDGVLTINGLIPAK